ncbi:MAG: hypothetical protein K0S07_1447 [Chlamydiales bacterium]|jgi:hypothetical protein|nr:hypothetical protein [Chlamydiales bacterium]
MTRVQWLLLKTLISQAHPGREGASLELLPPEESEAVQQAPLREASLSDFAQPLESFLNPFHPSWLFYYLEKMTEEAKGFVLQSLPFSLQEKMELSGDIIASGRCLAPLIKDYFLTQFKEKIEQELASALPLIFLEKNPFSLLLNFSEQELLVLVDLLGMHDLSLEIRHIVETKRLQKIYATLNPLQLKYLRTCLHFSDSSLSAKLNLAAWDERADPLRKALHYRGLLRLACALSGLSEDFMWHLCHRFDKKRGDFLLKRFSREEVPGLTPAISLQVNHAIGFIKNQKSP